MKKEKLMISANEINRFVYCPYQWYYKKTYGESNLSKQYKAMHQTHSGHESFYAKGTQYHHQYHRRYQLNKILIGIVIVLILATIVGMIVRGV